MLTIKTQLDDEYEVSGTSHIGEWNLGWFIYLMGETHLSRGWMGVEAIYIVHVRCLIAVASLALIGVKIQGYNDCCAFQEVRAIWHLCPITYTCISQPQLELSPDQALHTSHH